MPKNHHFEDIFTFLEGAIFWIFPENPGGTHGQFPPSLGGPGTFLASGGGPGSTAGTFGRVLQMGSDLDRKKSVPMWEIFPVKFGPQRKKCQ